MNVEMAAVQDAQPILALQKLAYISEAEIHNDYDIDPLKQSLEDLQADFEKQVFLKVLVSGNIVGSVRGYMDSGTGHIGRLMVHPEFQNQGIGKLLMNGIESFFPNAERYELFTGHKSERNLTFYQKLGYKAFRTERINSNLVLVFLERRSDGGR